MHALKISVNGSGDVVSTPAGIDCGAACIASFADGTQITLAATAASGMQFEGFGGATCSGTTCTFTLTADATVYATFSPKVNPCDAIAAPANAAMQQYKNTQGHSGCISGVGDASGSLAFPSVESLYDAHGSEVDIVSPAGPLLHEDVLGFFSPNVVAQPSGFMAMANGAYLNGPAIEIHGWGHDGTAFTPNYLPGSVKYIYAGDPNGGLLVAGIPGGTPGIVEMFDGPTTPSALRWGPLTLASSGAIFGMGVDLNHNSLVITAGSGGAISGQWFSNSGTALTGEFTLLSSFTPGASTWFETSPLIGGGLLVRRMDATPSGTQAHALVEVLSGSTTVTAAPSWMTSRPNVQLFLARSGKAYAALPYNAANVDCSQTVELLAPDGTSCSTKTYAIAAGTCTTGDMTLGLDGTVIQQLPQAMEDNPAPVDGNPWQGSSCTWRFWPAALR